jgi:hypothetical protein
VTSLRVANYFLRLSQDQEVRRSLIVKTDHLLSLFDNPRQVIAKRNDKLLDHHRYLSKKLPSDRKGSEDFSILSSQLLEELPRFLGSVSRYFNIIVAHFAGTQAAYHEALQERWTEFSQQWLTVSPGGTSGSDIESHHATTHQPVAQIMESLAAGLGIAVARSFNFLPLPLSLQEDATNSFCFRIRRRHERVSPQESRISTFSP